MSIFDDLTKDSFLSKKATSKQSGGSSRKGDTELASDMSTRNKADAEIASDLSARNKADAGVASDMVSRNKADTELGSDIASRNRADTEIASDISSDKSADMGTNSKNAVKNPHADVGSDVIAKPDNNSNVSYKGMEKSDIEAASDMSGTNQYGTQTYSHAGVAFNKVSDGEAKINYAGMLSKDGAYEVIGVYGYGSNQNWEDVKTVKLTKDYSGNFTGTIPLVSGKNINVAFKDTAENWDNNSGLNYTFVN